MHERASSMAALTGFNHKSIILYLKLIFGHFDVKSFYCNHALIYRVVDFRVARECPSTSRPQIVGRGTPTPENLPAFEIRWLKLQILLFFQTHLAITIPSLSSPTTLSRPLRRLICPLCHWHSCIFFSFLFITHPQTQFLRLATCST